ncbi:MAG: hypothetical protein HQ521_12270 [Bacteroidetes bacterium]|nr:hypothetical protein [Bacteroidota bacterium]
MKNIIEILRNHYSRRALLAFLLFQASSAGICDMNLIKYTNLNVTSLEKYSGVSRNILELNLEWKDHKDSLIKHKMIIRDIECGPKNSVIISDEEFFFGDLVPSDETQYYSNETVVVYTLFNVIYRIQRASKAREFVLDGNVVFPIHASSLDSIMLRIPVREYPGGGFKPTPPTKPDWLYRTTVSATAISILVAVVAKNQYNNATSSNEAIHYRELSKASNMYVIGFSMTTGYLTYKKYFYKK